MNGVKLTSYCATAVLICGNSLATAAAPEQTFDTWSVTKDATIECPDGADCTDEVVSGDGFFQRQITYESSGNDYFQTIITEHNFEPEISGLVFSDESFVQTGNTSGLADSSESTSDTSSPDPACILAPAGTDTGTGFTPSTNAFNSFTFTSPSFDLDGDFTPPSVSSPDDIVVPVNGHADFIDLDPANGGALPNVSDDVTDTFDFSIIEDTVIGPLPPGRHTLTWEAEDNAGNLGSDTQQIDIIPRVNFEADQLTTEGRTVTVTAHLNGSAADYPVEIPFTVSGTATGVAIPSNEPELMAQHGDHNALDGTIVIESGTIGQVEFYVADDDLADAAEENDESVIFTIGEPSNAVVGQKQQHTVTITDTPRQLTLDFVMAQDNQTTPWMTTDNGMIRVSALPLQQNGDTAATFDWSQSNASLVGGDCTQSDFYVDPINLSPGFYRIHVTASEPGFPDQAASAEWWLRIDSAPLLSASEDSDGDGTNDDSEGYQDADNDGIPNYLDTIEAAYLIPGFPIEHYKSLNGKSLLNEYEPQAAEVGWHISGATPHINYPMLIATEPGLKLGAGSLHLYHYQNTAHVAFAPTNLDEFNNKISIDPFYDEDDPIQNDGNQFMVSLEISHLPQAGGTAKLVIPQTTGDYSEGYEPRVRSYTPAFGWQDLLEDNNNRIASALRNGDYCPPAGSEAYQTGLVGGFECLQLTLQDGGPNDADGYRNGRIAFNGGILPVQTTDPEPIVVEESESQIEPLIEELPNQARTTSTAANNTGGGGAVWLIPLFCLLGLATQRGKTMQNQPVTPHPSKTH